MKFGCSQLGLVFEADSVAVEAIKDVSFETAEGEFLTIVGPSGCGKTTLLRILAGLLNPTSGKVQVDPSRNGSKSGPLMVFQENGLFPWMTVLDNATFGLEMQGVDAQTRHSEASALLERFGLGGREKAYPRQLSAGMKQRVAVIRAFLSRPSALLMDEPFGALDYQTRLVLQQELLELWEQRRTSVVFVTHDIDEAVLLSDRVLVLSKQPATIVDDFRVELPRPRHLEVETSPEFLEFKRRILRKLGLAGGHLSS